MESNRLVVIFPGSDVDTGSGEYKRETQLGKIRGKDIFFNSKVKKKIKKTMIRVSYSPSIL